jgi:two-component system NtrC family sensor kinase
MMTIPDAKILIVDDEPQILTLVSRFLQRMGYDVQTAGGGATALELLATTSFALVLSDLKMPHVDGLRVMAEVRSRYPDTIFILMTAYGTIDSVVSVLRQGAYDYLTKPLDIEDLRSTVERALEHRTVVMQNKRLMEFLQEKNVVLEYLHRDEQRKSEQLNQVNAIARQITAILDLETLVRTVIRLVMPAFDFETFCFGIVEGDQISFRGDPLEGQKEPFRGSPFWARTEEGQVPFVRSRSDEPAPYDLIWPLLAGERIVGLWVADWRADAEYRDENLPYLESLVAQTVTAMENARLYALARRADELAFLNEVGRAANQSLDLIETIHSVLTCVRATFNASWVEICIWDEDQAIQDVFSLGPGAFRHDPFFPLECEFAHRIRQESVIVCGRADVDGLSLPSAGDPPLRSLLGVMLHFGQRRIGSLGVGRAEPGIYDLEDGRLLQVVGAQVSTAIENARLFEEVVSGRQTILQSRNTLQALFDGILDGIYIVDRENKVLAVNRTQANWAGPDVDELIGQPANLAFPTSHESLPLIAETFQSGMPQSCVERHRATGGGWTEWDIQTYPVASSQAVPDDGGDLSAGERTVDQVVVVVRDVTEQRMLEASLIRSEKLASVGRLAAGIAHEINNPMTVISANAQILREEIALTHPYYGSVELIDRASERASRIVRNLLDFSRAEQFEFVQTDLNRSVQDAVLLVEPQARRSNIEITMDLAPDLPLIWASPDHLHVVWLNLLLNARDAIQETEHGGWIRVTSYRHNDHVVVQISDNGSGIPTDELNQIYDPFFTTKPPGKGTGLGLFTCYRTVHRHGGEISVDSQLGIGTTFDVTLPVGQASTEPE